jgi:hypothetical protein
MEVLFIMSCKDKKDHKHKDDCCFSCCFEKEHVQDKVCCDFSVTEEVEPGNVIYSTNTTRCDNLVASGTIKNCGPFVLTVQFVRGTDETGASGTVIKQIIIPVDGCTAFTLSRFDTIRAFATGASADNPGMGEICITPRYTLN